MAISLASLNRLDTPKPPRIVFYGTAGIGKNSFFASAPKPVLIDIEGKHPTNSPVDAFPQAKSFSDIMEAFSALYSEDHEFETLGIDSLDWLEPMIWAETCRRNSWSSVEDPGYGKGYLATLDVWREYLDAINALRDDRNMVVIQLAHHEIRPCKNPDTDPYDRYQIKLHKRASDLVTEAADMVLFANFKTSVTKSDAGFNKKVVRGVGNGVRAIYTEERPAYDAKNMHNLPPELPFPKEGAWQVLADAIEAGRSAAKQEAA
jgi:hypothetical protein